MSHNGVVRSPQPGSKGFAQVTAKGRLGGCRASLQEDENGSEAGLVEQWDQANFRTRGGGDGPGGSWMWEVT